MMFNTSMFPTARLRRLRKTPLLRHLSAEVRLQPSDFVYPLFITEQQHVRLPVPSMPGIYRQSIQNTLIEIDQAMKAGIRAVILFGIPEEKDQEATSAWAEFGVVQTAIREIKRQFGQDLLVIADTCLCEYMSHGHCGIVMQGKILNDPSVDILARVAISQAQAGADIIAPSDMMDGRILWIREALDEAGYEDMPIMAYSAKYASGFYAPFRDAADSMPTFGDRRSYQMDPRNSREALREVFLDIQEGADIVMVKPALAYLDVIHQFHRETQLPVAAYSVSGEYSMIKAAAQNGWIDERSVVLESLTGIKRAGASIIITYYAIEAARWLAQESG